MTVRDLLLLVACATFAGALLQVARRLAVRGDIGSRLRAAYATLVPRIAALLLNLPAHLRGSVAGDERQLHRVEAARTIASILILAVPPVLAAHWTAQPELARHGVSVALGGTVWAIVTEIPGAAQAAPAQRSHPPRLPLWAVALIVLAMDVVVILLAISHSTQGRTITALCSGAALVALADLVSALLGLHAAAYGPD